MHVVSGSTCGRRCRFDGPCLFPPARVGIHHEARPGALGLGLADPPSPHASNCGRSRCRPGPRSALARASLERRLPRRCDADAFTGPPCVTGVRCGGCIARRPCVVTAVYPPLATAARGLRRGRRCRSACRLRRATPTAAVDGPRRERSRAEPTENRRVSPIPAAARCSDRLDGGSAVERSSVADAPRAGRAVAPDDERVGVVERDVSESVVSR